jgi:hypothetical protein
VHVLPTTRFGRTFVLGGFTGPATLVSVLERNFKTIAVDDLGIVVLDLFLHFLFCLAAEGLRRTRLPLRQLELDKFTT